MRRLNFLLVIVLVACALAVVTAQHRARKLLQALESESERGRALEVEYGQLQIELSTWALPSRIDKIASERLRMHAPDPNAIVRLPASAVIR